MESFVTQRFRFEELNDEEAEILLFWEAEEEENVKDFSNEDTRTLAQIIPKLATLTPPTSPIIISSPDTPSSHFILELFTTFEPSMTTPPSSKPQPSIIFS